MRQFTLRAFEFSNPAASLDLRQAGEARIALETAAAGKRWLSDLIAQERICSGYFYRFESSGEFSEVRPSFLFTISFYLFEGGRICPVRIWHLEERQGPRAAGPQWTVDFNGLPGWSLMASIEPRWYPVKARCSARPGVGMSERDWYERDCWSLQNPASHPSLENSPVTQYAKGLKTRIQVK
jgi:hypothetical protein